MTKIKGVCHNFDNCDMAAEKVVQETEKSHFVCEECGKPLYPVTVEVLPWWKKHKRLLICLGLILGIAAVAGGIVYGTISAKKHAAVRHEQQMRLDSIARAQQDSLLRLQIEQARLDSIEQARQDSIVQAQEQARQDSLAQAEKQKQQVAQKASNPTPSYSLSYGKWSGSWQSGKPHGMGTMTYTQSHLIDTRDPQKRTAQSGDYIIGEFYEGKLVQGVWYDASGNVKGSIIIGR